MCTGNVIQFDKDSKAQYALRNLDQKQYLYIVIHFTGASKEYPEKRFVNVR
ncbi:hypothetical protein CAL7716_101700 (plasmid) [Calothrix sp. PCC 7716]|nr:hypothetical protein CAL7716_101700 [Calothrix sp. PCC 7716]